MKKSVAITAVCLCLLAGICTGIIGCSDRQENDAAETAETIDAVPALTPVETDETDEIPETEVCVQPPVPTRNLTEDITAKSEDSPGEITPEQAAALSQLALDLAVQQKGQFLLSPVSVVSALAMTANGAGGETLAQMEQVLGLDLANLNDVMHSYMSAYEAELSMANSIWFRDHGFIPNDEFLNIAKAVHRADIFASPFDESAVQAINGWIHEKTGGMIPSMLDEIAPEVVMFLINAVYFEKQWVNLPDAINEKTFTAINGNPQTAQMLHFIENQYLEDEHAVGFVKRYMWCDYSFVALLPEEGMDPAEYLATLNGEKLKSILANPQYINVEAEIPKFQAECSVPLMQNLKDMGITNLFDPTTADLTGLGTAGGNLYVSDVMHKAVMEVDENGTKAAAATIVTVTAETEYIPPVPEKTVILDRPFVYMIVDNTNNIPLFIGTLESLE